MSAKRFDESNLLQAPEWPSLCTQMIECLGWYECYLTSFLSGKFDGSEGATGVKRALGEIELERVRHMREDMQRWSGWHERPQCDRNITWTGRLTLYNGGQHGKKTWWQR